MAMVAESVFRCIVLCYVVLRSCLVLQKARSLVFGRV